MPDLINESHAALAPTASAAERMSALSTTDAEAKVFARARHAGCDRYDPNAAAHHDYTLFQQAILQRAPEAWEQIYQLYAPLVQKWIMGHPHFAHTDEDIDYFVNRTFEKLWYALTPAKLANFAELKPLLAYLQMCVNSVIIDHLRTEKRYGRTIELSEENPLCAAAPAQTQLRHEAERRHFWACIRKRLKNETEYKLIYYRFVLGIKPRQLCTEFGDIFPNVAAVYTLTQNILARLRRDARLAAYRQDPALMDALS